MINMHNPLSDNSPFQVPQVLKCKRNHRSGMALYLVMAVVFIMALLMPVYFSFSRQLSFNAFSQLNEERLALIGRIIHESTFSFIQTHSRNNGHDLTKEILNSIKNTTVFEIEKLQEKYPTLKTQIEKSIPTSITLDDCNFSISLKILEQTHKNAEGDEYYPGEGLAVMEITVIASLKRSRTLLSSCKFVRQYDIKSVCYVASDEGRYSMGFPLRYALMVRNAHYETTGGQGEKRYRESDAHIRLTDDADADKADIFLYKLGEEPTKKGNYLYPTPQIFYNFKDVRLGPLDHREAKGPNGFRPFRNSTLYAARFNGRNSFLNSGIFDKKTGHLYLPGLVDIQKEDLTLESESGTIKVFGKGGLLVPKGITIKSRIELNDRDQDMCVIFTRGGRINLESNEIEAALLAFNDNNPADGGIKSPSHFNVFGCIGVDQLFRHSATFECTIEYDKRFKAENAADEIFGLTLSPWVRFEYKSFSRQDLL